jgi:hypothetical protein
MFLTHSMNGQDDVSKQNTQVRRNHPLPTLRQADGATDRRFVFVRSGCSHARQHRRFNATVGQGAKKSNPIVRCIRVWPSWHFRRLRLLCVRAQASGAVKIGGDDIGGGVTGPNGPEAGVWVIAETRELPTRFARMVPTDDQGRCVVPDLPKVKHTV